jgi:hypothetical protein
VAAHALNGAVLAREDRRFAPMLGNRGTLWRSAPYRADYLSATGRHTLQARKPAAPAASAEWKRRRYSGFILLALRQAAWHKIPVVGVAK